MSTESDRERPRSADAFELTVLQNPEKLRLKCERELSDLVEKRRPPICDLELALLLLDSTREGAFLVAEELACEKVLGESGAVDFDEQSIASITVEMDGPRRELLSSAALAGDEHGRLRRCGAGDDRLRCFELWAFAHHFVDEVEFLLQLAILGPQASELARLFEGYRGYARETHEKLHRVFGKRSVGLPAVEVDGADDAVFDGERERRERAHFRGNQALACVATIRDLVAQDSGALAKGFTDHGAANGERRGPHREDVQVLRVASHQNGASFRGDELHELIENLVGEGVVCRRAEKGDELESGAEGISGLRIFEAGITEALGLQVDGVFGPELNGGARRKRRVLELQLRGRGRGARVDEEKACPAERYAIPGSEQALNLKEACGTIPG